ncbi:MAG: phosphate ABC transporter permease PstC, partial [Proteobacteria bacterium]|nr:phosphate ABC transporter permease PstC [Pseudomonadota bacterium]
MAATAMAATKRKGNLGDFVFSNLTRFFALLTLAMLGGIIGSLVYGAWPAIERFGFGFLWSGEWNPPMER